MKYELGNFDGSQIRINTSLLPEYKYNSKMAHEMAHHYVTYLSTLGILQEIVKEFKGIDNKTYKYLFKRGNKVQEVTALFYEYVSGGDAEVKERFIKSLNGITTDVKQILIDLINDINCHTKKKIILI
ncbi:hypothetical protein [Streptococcus uberis]|uniref:hypothetical protein n=1 Tax=Streptococcus uberis TaxID=1349 RepID=UPI00193AC506|nr:hypothetical protein [Streptococcus uberis]